MDSYQSTLTVNGQWLCSSIINTKEDNDTETDRVFTNIKRSCMCKRLIGNSLALPYIYT